MSARVIDFLGLRRGIALTIEEFVPDITTHWENQNQPAPQNVPYISLSFVSGFVYSALAQEKKITVTSSATLTIPDPLPPVGEAVWILIDDWAPAPQRIIQVGDTPESVRDLLLVQIQNLRPVKYAGYFSAAAQGLNEILLTSLQLGGIIQVVGMGGILVVAQTEVALYASMPLTFLLRMQCHGLSSTASTDFVSVGYNHPASIWSTLCFKMRSRSFAKRLMENAAVALWSYPSGGQELPELVGAGIEPRVVGEVYCATQALDFNTLPQELQQIFVQTESGKINFEYNVNINSKPQLPLP